MNFSDTLTTSGDPMLLSLLCPTQCAERVVDELLAIAASSQDLTARRPHLVRLVRQLVRDQYEICAQIVECYVPEHDLEEGLSGLEACDGAAEKIRKLSDERVLSFVASAGSSGGPEQRVSSP